VPALEKIRKPTSTLTNMEMAIIKQTATTHIKGISK